MLNCAYSTRYQDEAERLERVDRARRSRLTLERAAEDPITPIRGLMLAMVLSGILWAGLILSAREIWALCH